MATAKHQAPFFLHYANTHRNALLMRLRSEHGLEGYGLYIILLERLREEPDFELPLDYQALCYDLHCEEKLLRSVVNDFGLFAISDDTTRFHSLSLNEKMEAMVNARQKRGEGAKKAAEARWSKGESASSTPAPVASVSAPVATAPSSVAASSAPVATTPASVAASSASVVTDKLTSEIETMKADREWKEVIAKEHGISEAQIDKFLITFKDNCIANGQKNGHANILDASRHCRSYIRKMVSSQQAAVAAAASKNDELRERQRREEEKRRQDRQEYEAHKQTCQSADNYFRNKGYEPGSCTMRQLSDPEWVRLNPPKHPEWIGRFPGR